ncbi:MAG: HEPN domain-containing protein [Planctomycetes bacterium]|nr:HEPN domain-containing protein [Planctomycetota bacterium]
MKTPEDLAQGWWRKGDSDLAAARVVLDAGTSLDTTCFHAQQAAEKHLKAFLSFHGVAFPFTHNIEVPIDLCATLRADFLVLKVMAQQLTPFAVEARYNTDFWPDHAVAASALDIAGEIRRFVYSSFSESFRTTLPPLPDTPPRA